MATTTILYRLKNAERQCVVHVPYYDCGDDAENQVEAIDQWQKVMDAHEPMCWLDCELDAVILPSND